MTWGAIQLLMWGFIVAVIAGAYALLPAASAYPLPTEVGDAIALIAGYMKMFEFILPVDLLFNMVGLIFTFEVAIFAYQRAIWVLGLISGAGR